MTLPPKTLLPAKIFLFLQIGMPLLLVVTALRVLLDLGLPSPQERGRAAVTVIVALLAAFAAALLGTRLRGARPVTWACAVLLQLGFAVGYGWFAYDLITEPSPEGMASFVGTVIGGPLVLMSLAGLGFLLASAKHCLRRQPA